MRYAKPPQPSLGLYGPASVHLAPKHMDIGIALWYTIPLYYIGCLTMRIESTPAHIAGYCHFPGHVTEQEVILLHRHADTGEWYCAWAAPIPVDIAAAQEIASCLAAVFALLATRIPATSPPAPEHFPL